VSDQPDPAELALDELRARVGEPDPELAQAARDRQTQLTKPAGAFGRLEDLSVWVAAAQGQCPPHDFARARVVVFAGDHGVVTAGVSAYPPEVTGQMVHNFLTGGAALNALARLAGATVRVVDMSVATDTTPEVSGHKVRRGSGRIDRENALTHDETLAALSAGVAIADEEVDAGADLLIPGDMGIGNTTTAAVLIGTVLALEPTAVTGRGTGLDDVGWMRKVTVVRDAMRRARPQRYDPIDLLTAVGGADIAAMTGFLIEAAARRTPVLLDGVVSGAAAVMAREMCYDSASWWLAGHRSTEPAHTAVLEALNLAPIVELGMRLGEGSGALVALPVVRAAVVTLAEMATFDDAAVSGRVDPE
jgi:nicotinate-nucleotide--dimethylbenzimidazole phosphoribosyltransferase